MTNFDYRTTFITREATECRIAQIIDQVRELALVPGDVLSYTTVREMMVNLTTLRCKLEADLKYFDAIDRAMEQAVR